MKPLSGIRILDLSRVLAGPWATQILADLGAEVIKIERPGVGDETRAWGPPFLENEDGVRQSAYFLSANRGKASLSLDLKNAEDLAEVKDLCLSADVVIENFKVGDMAKYGLDADTLRAKKQDLVYLSLTGFGQTGPRAGEAGYDLLLQGLAGLMSITGKEEPTKVGVALIDILTGLYAVIAILAGLRARDQGQGGSRIDLALFDVAVSSLANQAMNFLVGGKVPQRLGNQHPNIAPYETFEVADGHLILAVGNDGQFAAFCAAADLKLHEDARFTRNADRIHNRKALSGLLEPVMRSKSREQWMTALAARKVPCGPIQTIDEVFADPQAIARGLVRHLDDPDFGSVPTLASPLRFDGVPMTSTVAPPKLS